MSSAVQCGAPLSPGAPRAPPPLRPPPTTTGPTNQQRELCCRCALLTPVATLAVTMPSRWSHTRCCPRFFHRALPLVANTPRGRTPCSPPLVLHAGPPDPPEPQVKPDDMHSVLLHSAHVTYYGMMVGLLDFQGDALRRYGSRTAEYGSGTGDDGAGARREGVEAEEAARGWPLGGLDGEGGREGGFVSGGNGRGAAKRGRGFKGDEEAGLGPSAADW